MKEALMSCNRDIYSAVSRPCDKSEKININSSLGNRIFGNDNQLQEHYSINAKTKNGKFVCSEYQSWQNFSVI